MPREGGHSCTVDVRLVPNITSFWLQEHARPHTEQHFACHFLAAPPAHDNASVVFFDKTAVRRARSSSFILAMGTAMQQFFFSVKLTVE